MDSYQERREAAKEEKKRQKKGTIKIKGIRYVYGCQILKFEKHCFGYHYEGNEVEDDVSYQVTDSGHIKKNHNITKWAYFSRPKVWKKNFLFGLTELLSKFVSWVGRVIIGFFPFAIIAGVICIIADASKAAIIIGAIYAGVIALRFALAGLGFLWKKVFKLEEKTDKILLENGYAIWDENEEGSHSIN